MLNVLKRWWQWISAIDTALSWAGRAWMGYLLLTSTSAGVLLGTIAWLAQNFVYGVWAFLGTWVLVTAAQAFRVVKHSGGAPPERSAETKAEDSTRQLPQLSEAERAELQRLRGEVVSLTGQKDKLQEEINSRDADREMYWSLLAAALREGLELRESNPSMEEAQEWATYLHKLIEEAEGEWRVKPFKRPTPGYAYADPDATGAQAFMDYLLGKLQNLIQLVRSRRIIMFRSGFDPHNWKDWKSPPSTDSEEAEHLKARLRKIEQERDKLWTSQRLERLENWRSVIRRFDFEAERFAGTNTYTQMKPDLQPEVIEMLEAQRTVHIGNESRGDTAYRHTLLDEVTRIEKEWGLS